MVCSPGKSNSQSLCGDTAYFAAVDSRHIVLCVFFLREVQEYTLNQQLFLQIFLSPHCMLGAILVINDIAVNKNSYILVGSVHLLKFKYEGGEC